MAESGPEPKTTHSKHQVHPLTVTQEVKTLTKSRQAHQALRPHSTRLPSINILKRMNEEIQNHSLLLISQNLVSSKKLYLNNN